MTQKRCPGCMQPVSGAAFCPHCGYPLQKENEAHQLSAGTMLQGRYLVGKVLGQGGFGITYLGLDCQSETTVAIKEYYPSSQVTRDTVRGNRVHCYTENQTPAYLSSKERFLREARTLSLLQDVPAIVRVQECFEENDTVYIIMEFIRGTDLRHYIARRGSALGVSEILSILRPIMEALEAVHRRGLVHRDISPDNIMLHPSRGAVLLDFGAVRDVANADVNAPLTKSTEAILKHGFAPLEQYRSRGSLGPWTDVYALCATIYYCLTLKVPPEALARMMGEETLDWSAVPELTARQRSALERGMAVHAKDRTASVALLMEDLYPPKPAPIPEPMPDPRPVPSAPRPVPPAPQPAHPAPRPSGFSWKRAALIGGVALLLVASSAITVLVMKRPSGKNDVPKPEDTAVISQAVTEPVETLPPEVPEETIVPEETEAIATLPAETETAPVETLPAFDPQTFLQETPERLDTVYYSSSGLDHNQLECTWDKYPTQITFPADSGFSEENTVVKILDSSERALPMADHPFGFLWGDGSVEIYVPQGLPEGVYNITFTHNRAEVGYVICVGTPGQSYTVRDSVLIHEASLFHEASSLYLHHDGQKLTMVEKDDRTFFTNDSLFEAIVGDGAGPAFAGVTEVNIQEMHVQNSGSSSYYLIRCGDHYLAYSTAKGLYLTQQISGDCKWNIHYN